jgi:hypothetical protein
MEDWLQGEQRAPSSKQAFPFKPLCLRVFARGKSDSEKPFQQIRAIEFD